MATTKEKKPSFIRRYRWLLLLLLLAGGAGGYYLYRQNGGAFSLVDSFTRYRQYPADTLATAPGNADTVADIPALATRDTLPPDSGSNAATVPDSFLGFALPVYDALPPIDAGDPVVDSAAIAVAGALLTGKDSVRILDTTGVLAPPPSGDPPLAPTSPTAKAADSRNDDIFDGLLPASYQSAAAEETFLKAYASNTISTRGGYKLVTIAGKALLLGESPEVLEMLNTLVDEEAIIAITVSDRQGRIVYASNPRERGRLITDIYADLPVTNEAINWMRKDGLTITGIPVFSVGGRLGTVFVTTM